MPGPPRRRPQRRGPVLLLQSALAVALLCSACGPTPQPAPLTPPTPPRPAPPQPDPPLPARPRPDHRWGRELSPRRRARPRRPPVRRHLHGRRPARPPVWGRFQQDPRSPYRHDRRREQAPEPLRLASNAPGQSPAPPLPRTHPAGPPLRSRHGRDRSPRRHRPHRQERAHRARRSPHRKRGRFEQLPRPLRPVVRRVQRRQARGGNRARRPDARSRREDVAHALCLVGQRRPSAALSPRPERLTRTEPRSCSGSRTEPRSYSGVKDFRKKGGRSDRSTHAFTRAGDWLNPGA